MPKSRKLPAAQYDTIHHGAKTSGCPSSTPSAIRRQGRSVPALPQQQGKYGWHGASRNFTMICPHASPVPFTSIWKPYSTISPLLPVSQPEAGAYSESSQECIRQVCRKHGWKEEITVRPVHRGIRLGKHFVGIPPQGSRHSTTGYLNYRQVVQGIPTVGSSCTTQWYAPYLSKVLLVPNCGTDSTKQEIYWYMHTTDRQQVHNMNLRTYFHYLCSLYQQDYTKRKHEIRSKQKSICLLPPEWYGIIAGVNYPQDRNNDMADRFPILAFQDRRGHSRVPSLLFVCFQKALLQAHQTYRRKEEREETALFLFLT